MVLQKSSNDCWASPTSCLFCVRQRWWTPLFIRSVSRVWSSIFNHHVFKSLNHWPKISSQSVMTPSRPRQHWSWIKSLRLKHTESYLYIPETMSYRPTPTVITHWIFFIPEEVRASWDGGQMWAVAVSAQLDVWKRETDFPVAHLFLQRVGVSVIVLEKMPICWPERRLVTRWCPRLGLSLSDSDYWWKTPVNVIYCHFTVIFFKN